MSAPLIEQLAKERANDHARRVRPNCFLQGDLERCYRRRPLRALAPKVGRLLVEMQGSADNFAIIGRVKSGTTGAVERTKSWWNKVLEWFRG